MNMNKSMMIVQFQPWLKERIKQSTLYTILGFSLSENIVTFYIL